MRTTFLATSLFVLSSTVPLSGQGLTTTPSMFSDSWGTFAIAAPLGRSRLFFQHWHRGDQLGGRILVREIGWRQSDRSTSLPAVTHTMEVVLSNTTAGFQLSKTFAQNLGTSTTFLKMKSVSFPRKTAAPKDPNVPTLWIKGDAPFIYRGPNFIYQVDLQTSPSWGSSGYNVDGYSTSSTPIHRQGQASCGGSLTATYAAGNYTLTMRGAPASTQALMCISGNLTLVDLGAFFGTGCKWSVDPLLWVVVPVNASGTATLSLPWTVSTSDTLVLHAQGLHVKSSSPRGLVPTNVAHSALGPAGLNMYVYNWTRGGPVAQYGPYGTNRGPIILLR